MGMNGTIQKWGNSHAVRLPKAVLSAARFQENDLVAFSAEENRIVITKLCRRHRTLKERLASAPVQPQAGPVQLQAGPVQLQAGKEAPVFEEWNTGEPSEGEAL